MALNVLNQGFRLISALPHQLCNAKHISTLVNKPIQLCNSMVPTSSSVILKNMHLFQGLVKTSTFSTLALPSSNILSRLSKIDLKLPQVEQRRNVTKFGLNGGGRKSVSAITDRFYRLQSGLWIRPKSGRNRRKYRKTTIKNRRLSQHVFCNKKQNETLDKMTSQFWKKPRFYVDNIYEPYERRTNFMHGRTLGKNFQF